MDNDFLLDPCDQRTKHSPHKYGALRPNDTGTRSIRHPLYCGGVSIDQDADD